ncbi:MAG: ATP-binding cassette domain-containing protein [Beduini sp.]|uniref:ATP-binding cassette domain-containing protein n=1 Tax=Beduini sp. TaxID=1922300 RepID=UPI0011CCB69B
MIRIKNYNQLLNHQSLFHIEEFEVKKNDFVMITGASGCGKTTLLNMLYHLPELKSCYREYVLQNNMLLDELTLKENIDFFIKENDEKTDKYLDLLELKHVSNLPAYQLSEGQKQRASFLRALLMQPEILFLDEITSKQNIEMIQIMMTLLKEYQSTMTIIMVTHDLSLLKYANKHYAFINGEVEAKKVEEAPLQTASSEYCGVQPIGKLVIKNIKAHFKEDILIMLCLMLLCMTFMLSFNAGKSLKSEISAWYQKQYSYYSLSVSFMDGVKDADEVIAISNQLGAEDYVLNMKLLEQPQTIIVEQIPIQIDTIEIDNTLAENTIKLPNVSGSKTDIRLSVFSGSKEFQYYRWAGSTKIYEPQYKQIEISADVLNNDQNTMALSSKTFVSLLKQAHDPSLDQSNLLVNSFVLRFDSEASFKEVKERLSTLGYYLYDYSDELKTINKQVTDQFNPFLYVSYFIVAILVVVTIILLISKHNKMKRSASILDYLHYSFTVKNSVYTTENVLIGVGALILSLVSSLLIMNSLNRLIDLSKYVSLGAGFEALDSFIQTIPLYQFNMGDIGVCTVIFVLFLVISSSVIQQVKSN